MTCTFFFLFFFFLANTFVVVFFISGFKRLKIKNLLFVYRVFRFISRADHRFRFPCDQ